MLYGYARISTKHQNIDRQIRNIKEEYPTAHIVEEVFTGTKFQERKKLIALVEKVKAGDTIIFDSVSRMSRNATDGFELYKALFDKGVNLVFLKEPHINTDTYRKNLNSGIQLTGTAVDAILKGIIEYMLLLAKDQIRLAFEQSQKEVDDLKQRTKEGLVTAKLNGKQVGGVAGKKLNVKKSAPAKEAMVKYMEQGLKDEEIMKLVGLARNTFYKYKKEIKEAE